MFLMKKYDNFILKTTKLTFLLKIFEQNTKKSVFRWLFLYNLSKKSNKTSFSLTFL